MAKKRSPAIYRLLKYIEIVDDCWVWNKTKDKDGYAVIGIGRGKQYRANRISFEIHKGICANGLLVCHTCDNRACVNPDHLFLGTPKDNTQDMIKKGRKAKNKPFKISYEDRKTIMDLRNEGKTLREIAVLFGVTFQTISAICLGKGTYGTGI